MKDHNEAVAPASAEEGCVSGLIGNVLSLIISILMWLQKVGCKNEAPGECPGTCDLTSALQQLTVFAAKAEDVGAISSGSKSKKLKKEDSKKSLKKSKSGDNRSVMYAVDQNDPDCKKCCKKVIEPKEKKSKDNVIFEVVAAQMVEEQTQTDVTMMVDSVTQPDEIVNSEKHIETDQQCLCASTQVSSPILNEKPPTQDAFVQVEIEIEKDVKDQLCECEIRDNVGDGEEDYEEDDEDYNEGDEDDYMMCPTECIQYAQRRQASYHQDPQYRNAQGQMRQDRPPFFPGYNAPPMYKQYNAGYAQQDAYAAMKYPYQTQPYYQKVTRTVQRGPPQRNPDYQNPPQRQKSPTQRPILVQEKTSGHDKNLQAESSPAPPPPATAPTITLVKAPVSSMSQRSSRNENVGPRPQVQLPKDCIPTCPGNKQKGMRPPPPPPAPILSSKPPPQEKEEVSKTASKKCVAKCQGNKNQSNQQKPPSPKEKPRQVALMPKGAIPVEHRDVLGVEESHAKQVVPDSVMSVEASKQKK